MEHEEHRQRLYARFEKEGFEAFAPHEVLEYLLTFSRARVDTNPIAHRLMDRFHSFPAVLEASTQELMEVEGVGPQSARLITAALGIVRYYEAEKRRPRSAITSRSELMDYCCSLFVGMKNEQLYLICLDGQLNLISTSLIATGTPSQVNALPRRIVEQAIRSGAVSAALAHNHPSGSRQPSAEDVEMTAVIQQTLEAIGVKFYDHFIVAGEQTISMEEEGLLNLPACYSMRDEKRDEAADQPLNKLPVSKPAARKRKK